MLCLEIIPFFIALAQKNKSNQICLKGQQQPGENVQTFEGAEGKADVGSFSFQSIGGCMC